MRGYAYLLQALILALFNGSVASLHPESSGDGALNNPQAPAGSNSTIEQRFQALEARAARSEALEVRVRQLERTVQSLLGAAAGWKGVGAAVWPGEVEEASSPPPPPPMTTPAAPKAPTSQQYGTAAATAEQPQVFEAPAQALNAPEVLRGASLRSRKQSTGTCTLADLSTHLNDIAATCCPGNDCTATSYPGANASCSAACGREVEPFWDGCGDMLGTLHMIPAGFGKFYDTCMATLYPPGQCGSQCTQSTYHCRVMEVNTACCSDPFNCPSSRSTPLQCPIGCGLLFPTFVSDCSATGMIPSTDMRDFNHFVNTCLHADPADLVEYAKDLIDDGCILQLPQSTGRPPHALPPSAPAFVADKWMANLAGQSTCLTFTQMWTRLSEAQQVCCQGNNCIDGHGDVQMPLTCSPDCALVFHDMMHDCGFLLNFSLPADLLDEWGQFDQLCLASSAVDARSFLRAIHNASCQELVEHGGAWKPKLGDELPSCMAYKEDSHWQASTGMYWLLAPTSGANPYIAFCEMDTQGGGWTLAMTINPADSNFVGFYHDDFWVAHHEYGPFSPKISHALTNDYKSPAAYLLDADEVMLQSTDFGNMTAQIKGWRIWPFFSTRTWGSFFINRCPGTIDTSRSVQCDTQPSSAANVGTTSSYDQTIRFGTCLSMDTKYGNGYDDGSRVTTSLTDTDNRMNGFGAMIDNGNCDPGRGAEIAACSSSDCAYSACRQMRDPALGSSPQTHGSNNYCQQQSVINGWLSRFFVR
jgi:hypothetical protein